MDEVSKVGKARAVGVDIGGSKIAAAWVDEDGLIDRAVVTKHHARHEDELLPVLLQTIRKVVQGAGSEAPAIGLACAGTVDHAKGLVVHSPNLPLADTPLRRHVEEVFGSPVVLENDVNAALVAEYRLGAARGFQHAVMITLGTGIGGALLLDGRIYRGAQGAAGEIGHTVVDRHGEPCRCGRRGCLEAYVGAGAFERIGFRTVGLFERGAFTGELIGRLAREGSAAALEALDDLGQWLGVGLANITNIFNPEVIVIGGGLAELDELLLAPARAELERSAMRPGRDLVRVVKAELGPNAGMVGAGLLALDILKS